jgi:AmmeMemoRadiSam system protein A
MVQEDLLDTLSNSDKKLLLKLAREAIALTLNGAPVKPFELDVLSEQLREPGASFVTLTIGRELRGCVGALEAYLPLVEDVREHAIAAAFHDYRFPPLTMEEFRKIKIEISRLTKPIELVYEKPEQLLELLKPHVDGVILNYQKRRATFLPQVWEKIPDPETFLDHLCQKMGVNASMWRYQKFKVSTYQVEMFEEE